MSLRNPPDIDAAAFFIQSTIVVTMATATSDATPAMASAARPLMVFSPNWIVRNTTSVIAIAALTPSQTHRRASRRSDLTRKATRIDTTIAASRPSRRPIKPLPNSCEVKFGDAASVLEYMVTGRSVLTLIGSSSLLIQVPALACQTKVWLTLVLSAISECTPRADGLW